MNSIKIGILIGGILIAITVIVISVVYPNYLNTFVYDVNNIENMETDNSNQVANDSDNNIVDIRGPPLTTYTGGEESNYDFVVPHVSQEPIPDNANGIITDTGAEQTNNYLTTFSIGEEGNPISGPTTTGYGEEGNPAYPQMTTNIKGAESSEFNDVIDPNHTYDYAGLGVY